MDKRNILTDLRREKDTIRMQIAALEADLEAVDRLLKRFSSNHQIEPNSTQLPQPNVLGLTGAVKQLFDHYPNKDWAPAEIRDRLNEMKRRGELKTEAKDFLPIVHMIIKGLIKNNFVGISREQDKPAKRKWYKRKFTLKELETFKQKARATRNT